MNESFVNDDFIRKVIDDYSDMIFRISFQYVRNAQDAEEVVQDVLLLLVEYLHRAAFQSDEHMKAWLIRVTMNKSINVYKANARRRKKEAAALPLPAQSEFDDLEFTLSKLSALDREIVYLHYYEGYSAKEIGELLHKTEKAVFKRLSRARNTMKEFLSEEDR